MRTSGLGSLALALGMLASACSSSSQAVRSTAPSVPSSTSTVPATTAVPAATAPCATPSRFDGQVVHGTSRDGELWGLVLGRVPPRAGDDWKIVVRMTGTGPLAVAITAPDGRAQPLAWGPEPHSGSTFHKPGEEWGIGFRLAGAGCWHIHLRRSDTTGDAWFDVRA